MKLAKKVKDPMKVFECLYTRIFKSWESRELLRNPCTLKGDFLYQTTLNPVQQTTKASIFISDISQKKRHEKQQDIILYMKMCFSLLDPKDATSFPQYSVVSLGERFSCLHKSASVKLQYSSPCL